MGIKVTANMIRVINCQWIVGYINLFYWHKEKVSLLIIEDLQTLV